MNVGIGICLGMVPLVAYTYSSKDHQRMEEIIRYSRNVGVLLTADVLTVAVSIFVYRNYRRSQNVDGMCGTIL